jgi:hypothetical protein
LGTIASTVSARCAAWSDGETYLTRPSNWRPAYASTSNVTGWPTAIAAQGSGIVVDQRVDADDGRDLHPLGHVVADRHQPLGDDAAERRADDGVGAGLARQRDAGARRLQRLVLLRGAVLGRLVLLPRRFHLRFPLVVFRLRDDALIEQRLDAVELALGEREARLGVYFGAGDANACWVMPERASMRAALARFASSWSGRGIRPSAPAVTGVPRRPAPQ